MREPGLPHPLLVVGAGGQGRETVSLLRDLEKSTPGVWQLLGVIADDEPDHNLLQALETTWLGPTARLAEYPVHVVVAVGDGPTRRRLQALAVSVGQAPTTLVHPTASLGGDVQIGEGSVIGAQSALTTHVRLGAGVQVNVGCSISHDVSLGDFATLAPGVRTAGCVEVGEGATVFTGATILPGVRVGAHAIVGAGAVVVQDVPEGLTVAGVPARPLA